MAKHCVYKDCADYVGKMGDGTTGAFMCQNRNCDYKTKEREGKMPKQKQNTTDIVQAPSHYTDGKIEVWSYIADKKLNFALGSAIKYISRAGKKEGSDTITDLRKAMRCLELHITDLERERIGDDAADKIYKQGGSV